MTLLGLLLLPVVAVAGALARWLLQARGNLYTDASTRYYVPDPDLGWRVVDSGPVSLGLDAVALLVVYAAALAVGFLLVRRWQRRGRRLPAGRAARLAPQILAGLPLLVPAWAFASGTIPSNASEYAPAGLVEAPPDSIAGGLPGLQAGVYRVVPHAGTSITAHLSGGGEKFDARFARDIEGTWRGAPADLRQPMRASVSVATTAVNTGIELRSKHAREEYLVAARFPRIAFHLERLLGRAAPRRRHGGLQRRGHGAPDGAAAPGLGDRHDAGAGSGRRAAASAFSRATRCSWPPLDSRSRSARASWRPTRATSTETSSPSMSRWSSAARRRANENKE